MATSFGFRFLAVFFPREYVNFKPFEIADLQSTKKPDVSFAFELFWWRWIITFGNDKPSIST